MSWSEWQQRFSKYLALVCNFWNCLQLHRRNSAFCRRVWAGWNLNKPERCNFSFRSGGEWYAVWCFQLLLLRDVARLEPWKNQSSSFCVAKDKKIKTVHAFIRLQLLTASHACAATVVHQRQAHTYTAPVPGQLLAATDAIPQTFAYLMLCGKQRRVCVTVSGTSGKVKTMQKWEKQITSVSKTWADVLQDKWSDVEAPGSNLKFSLRKKEMACYSSVFTCSSLSFWDEAGGPGVFPGSSRSSFLLRELAVDIT